MKFSTQGNFRGCLKEELKLPGSEPVQKDWWGPSQGRCVGPGLNVY